MNQITETSGSAIYRGFVRHRRFAPKHHEFRYPLFMVLLKISEIPSLSERIWVFGTRWWHWARFRREDYLSANGQSLQTAVRMKIAELSGQPCTGGEVYLLGQLRYLGLYFSPLNLYFLYRDGQCQHMLAEVSNTPWNQRHYYLLDLNDLQPHDKAFHVSPFNSMDQRYQWSIRPPHEGDTKAMVHLTLTPSGAPQKPIFDATLVLRRQPLNQSRLMSVLAKVPIQTAAIIAGIYWEALKLFLKGIPFHAHPGRRETPTDELTGHDAENIVSDPPSSRGLKDRRDAALQNQ